MSTYYNIAVFNTGDYSTYQEAQTGNGVYFTPSTIDCMGNDGLSLSGVQDLLEVINTMMLCFSLTGVCSGVVTDRGFITLGQIIEDEGKTPISDLIPLEGNERRIAVKEFLRAYGSLGIACILSPNNSFRIHSQKGALLLESRGYIKEKSNGGYTLTELGQDMKEKITNKLK